MVNKSEMVNNRNSKSFTLAIVIPDNLIVEHVEWFCIKDGGEKNIYKPSSESIGEEIIDTSCNSTMFAFHQAHRNTSSMLKNF